MSEEKPTPRTDRERLSPKTITERFADLSVGDRITFNDRERSYEVVETDRYSVTIADPNGNRITLSQNLQTGGWVVHEEVWWIDSESDSDS